MTEQWWTGPEITRVFAVTASKLAAFSRRGDLPRRLGADGLTRYPLDVVHELFPRRGSASLEERPGESLAVLGETALGAPAGHAAEVKILSRPPHPAPSAHPLRTAVG
jgi:hypothetical protein